MKERGFAIVIVLFGLSIVTALYAISSTLTLASIKRNSTDAQLARDASTRFGLIEAISAGVSFDGPVSVVDVSGVTLELREVSGLVDLNAASRPLLELFFDKLGYTNEQFEAFIDWRADGRRVLRLEDLSRIAGEPTHSIDLYRLATLYSGKQGVAPEAITNELLELMDWGVSGIPDPYTAPLGSAVYQVYEMDPVAGQERYLGTVSRSADDIAILELR